VITLDTRTENIGIKNIRILTLPGIEVLNNSYAEIVGSVRLRLENIQKGVYIYDILDSTEKKHIGKIVVK
jgi:hypothetical protein